MKHVKRYVIFNPETMTGREAESPFMLFAGEILLSCVDHWSVVGNGEPELNSSMNVIDYSNTKPLKKQC
jgi:hypothetical protein